MAGIEGSPDSLMKMVQELDILEGVWQGCGSCFYGVWILHFFENEAFFSIPKETREKPEENPNEVKG